MLVSEREQSVDENRSEDPPDISCSSKIEVTGNLREGMGILGRGGRDTEKEISQIGWVILFHFHSCSQQPASLSSCSVWKLPSCLTEFASMPIPGRSPATWCAWASWRAERTLARLVALHAFSFQLSLTYLHSISRFLKLRKLKSCPWGWLWGLRDRFGINDKFILPH